MDDDEYYHHHKFDFVVGKDGNIDEAIKAANGEAEGKPYNNNKINGHRYYIFVPDGEYKLTGNGTISFEGEGPVDETGTKRPDMNGKNNGQTHIRKPNISIIGQSIVKRIIARNNNGLKKRKLPFKVLNQINSINIRHADIRYQNIR